ncbi:MAG: glucose 1-dehydrogenase [Anaerolineae bacterium]|nr:glucose 1-dehydrogenase [Anaerolineae bacterium]
MPRLLRCARRCASCGSGGPFPHGKRGQPGRLPVRAFLSRLEAVPSDPWHGKAPALLALLGHNPAGRLVFLLSGVLTQGARGHERDCRQKVLVTGGSSGIGQAIAIKMAEYGADVAINFRSNRAEAEATEQSIAWCRNQVQQHGGQDLLIQADVSKKEDVERMFEEVIAAWGTVDFLINNAGIQIAADSHMLDVEKFIQVININTVGAFRCAQRAIQHWLAQEKPGVIINVSSVHQIIPKPRFVGYSVSKGGMQNLTRTLALEYAGHNIRVNGIGPGATITPINRAWVDDPEKRAQVESHIPMRRAGEAEEMAEAAAFLCSDLAAYITGQTLFIDGGLTLYADFETAWSSE